MTTRPPVANKLLGNHAPPAAHLLGPCPAVDSHHHGVGLTVKQELWDPHRGLASSRQVDGLPIGVVAVHGHRVPQVTVDVKHPVLDHNGQLANVIGVDGPTGWWVWQALQLWPPVVGAVGWEELADEV